MFEINSVLFPSNPRGTSQSENRMDGLEEGVNSGQELEISSLTTRGKITSVLVAKRKGKERIDKRDISKKKGYILVTA